MAVVALWHDARVRRGMTDVVVGEGANLKGWGGAGIMVVVQ